MQGSVLLRVAAASLLFSACSSTSSPADPNGNGGNTTGADGGDRGNAGSQGSPGASGTPGASGPDGGGGPSDAGSRDASSGDGAAEKDAAPPGPLKHGQITAGQTVTLVQGNEYDSSYVTAMFYEMPTSGGGSCTVETISGCMVSDCDLSQPRGDAGSLRYAGGGELRVTGGRWNIDVETSDGGYVTQSSQQKLFTPGTVLHLTTTGAEVPAFAADVTAPSDLDLLTPTFDANRRTALPRSKALAVSWSGSTGSVQVSISTAQNNVRSVGIVCDAAASAGSLTVPAQAMAKLLPADGSAVTGALAVSPMGKTELMAGAFAVTFQAMGSGGSGLFTTTD